jgi:hypothetical protein
MPNILDQLLNTIYNNFIWIALGVGGIWLLINYLKVRKNALKIIDRAKVEQIKFIERMNPNKMSNPINLMRGSMKMGKVTHSSEFETLKTKINKTDPDEKIKVTQFVVKPYIFNLLPNPFSKIKCFEIASDLIFKDFSKWILPEWVNFGQFLGIYYDLNYELDHRATLRKTHIFETDLNNLASIYFVKSQEQTTFDPIHAHEMALREKELEIELAKKKGIQESI